MFALLFALAAGCTPSCADVCDKLVTCELSGAERLSPSECEESCNQQEALYDEWTDSQKRTAFDAELSCLYSSECADVEAGACYDAEVWSF